MSAPGRLEGVHVNAIFEILHLICAVVFVSPMIVFPFLGSAALRRGDAPGAANAARSTTIWGLLALGVAIFGSLAVAGADPARLTFLTPWLLASLIAFLGSVVVAVAVVAPALRVGARSGGRGARLVVTLGAALTTALTVVVTVLMLWRPTG